MITLPHGLAVDVTPGMIEQLEQFAEELRAMNRRINLVSREDEDAIASRHIPHCLALAHKRFRAGSVVCDWGTGGGLPLIPLAIVFPDVEFVGVDAVRKKTMAVETMARRLGLQNVSTVHARAEKATITHNASVSRATAPLNVLWGWHLRSLDHQEKSSDEYWSGLVCLKGGELTDEIEALQREYPDVRVERVSVDGMFDDLYFVGKVLVTVEGIGSRMIWPSINALP